MLESGTFKRAEIEARQMGTAIVDNIECGLDERQGQRGSGDDGHLPF